MRIDLRKSSQYKCSYTFQVIAKEVFSNTPTGATILICKQHHCLLWYIIVQVLLQINRRIKVRLGLPF